MRNVGRALVLVALASTVVRGVDLGGMVLAVLGFSFLVMARVWPSLADAPSSNGHVERGLAMYRAGRYDDALRHVDAMIELLPEVAMSWRFRGECLEKLGRLTEAADALQEARRLGGPGTEEVFMMEALCAYRGGDTPRALRVLGEALKSCECPELMTKGSKLEALIEAGAIDHLVVGAR